MATVPTITTIQKTECIGNSLVTINSNYDNIKNSIAGLVNTDLAIINNTLTNLTTFVNNISSAQLAKAWVQFSGRRNNVGPSGTTDLTNTNRFIFNGYNIDYVSKNGTGIYTVTLKTPLNVNFSVTGTATPRSVPEASFTGLDACVVSLHPTTPFPNNNGLSCKIVTVDLNGSFIDPSNICLSFFSN